MIEYSKQESRIFGVPFGRLNIEQNFTNWSILTKEINVSPCGYIRVKIQNPGFFELDRIKTLGNKVHLLEVLRVYRSYNLLNNPVEVLKHDLNFIKINRNNEHLLEGLIRNTYDDVPFGNFTPLAVRTVIPEKMQLKALIEYFKYDYTGRCSHKVGYFIQDETGKKIGCFTTDFLKDSTYTYYVGVVREYRNKQIFFTVINYVYELTRRSGLPFGEGSARLMNLYSQQALEKSKMKCIRHDWIFLIEK